jgi:hypothetical protein
MRKIWMVAAATTTVFMLSAQDGAVETQGIGVIIDAHALVDVVNDEIVFDFSNDDPVEAGDAFVLGANKFGVTHLNYSLMMSNAGVADGSISVRLSNMNEGMSLSLLADRESVDLSQADLDGTPLSLQLESFARPVFSGIGNVNQLFVQLSIQGAQVSQHVGETLYTIQWKLVSGGCLVP